MKDCRGYNEAIQLYLDGELRGSGLIELRAHLERCLDCCQMLEAEEELACLLKRANPLYTAPDSLRERVEQIVGEAITETPLDMPPKQGR
jgi:mycothiol system anti-sigma-R factor